ncbi:hypothetical protein J2S00_000905 [Caldalkalibacillus uzonensis]|uniref:Uncharacterized protein n=1 Tax=Caldalkalibacillus uzonensis TaxID=353224 RepID=A0ABU0CNY2_9BACI|nr:hypothetical protein [Caldalkalibacillus uzonensis]
MGLIITILVAAGFLAAILTGGYNDKPDTGR